MGGEVTVSEWEKFAAERQIRYDAHDDEHYDTISAFIKSMRGCDPDAAVYWLAKMLEGGEDLTLHCAPTCHLCLRKTLTR